MNEVATGVIATPELPKTNREQSNSESQSIRRTVSVNPNGKDQTLLRSGVQPSTGSENTA